MSESKNYIVNLHGRGATYCGLAQNTQLEPLIESCQRAVNCGFEVFIFSIEPNPLGTHGFIPDGVINLKRHAHLYDARDEFEDEANSIINKLSIHSLQASETYLDLVINKLTEERNHIKEDRTYERTSAGTTEEPAPLSNDATIRDNPHTEQEGTSQDESGTQGADQAPTAV